MEAGSHQTIKDSDEPHTKPPQSECFAGVFVCVADRLSARRYPISAGALAGSVVVHRGAEYAAEPHPGPSFQPR